MNTVITSILPIFLMLLVALIFWSASKAASKKMILFSGKIIDSVLVVYIALLLISTVVTSGFGIKPGAESERVTDKEIAEAVEAGENFIEYLEKGMLADADGVYVNKKWKFPYENNRLVVTGSVIAADPIWVVVEKKNADNDQIEIVQYMTRSILDDYDYSAHLKPPKIIEYSEGIEIDRSEHTELKFTKFTKEFVVNQFTNKQFTNERIFGGVNNVRGQSVLYLRVPESIEVVEGIGVALQFVD